MQFKVDSENEIGGTSLQGYVTTTLAQLIEIFGEPERYAEGDKITVHWAIAFEDGTIATIYDWKRYEMGTPELTEVMEYNIGGESMDAPYLVKKAIFKN